MLTDQNFNPIVYPTSDGKPMAETDVHRDQMISLILALKDHFKARDDVYVSGNILMLYDKQDGRKHRSPDVLVVLGIPNVSRDNYKIWEEGKAPDVVIEVTSVSTREEDLGPKKSLYARLGIREYFMFDPLREYLKPQLRGYRLSGGKYLRMVGLPLQSEVLRLELRIVEDELRLYDPSAQSYLMGHEETVQKMLEAQEKAKAAQAQVAQAESRLAEVEARFNQEMETLRKRLQDLEGR